MLGIESGTETETWCPRCSQAVNESSLQACMICRRLFCRRCAIVAYGREFCSVMCRDVFFYGDDEESAADE